MSDVSLAFNMLIGRNDASSGISRMSNSVRAANVASAASAVALRVAEASAAAWAIALGSAISGSIGLAPAIFGGAFVAVKSFELGIAGLSTAWKALGQQSAASGPSAVEQAKQQAVAVDQVTSAQEALARAQRDALDAQRAINDAEESAAKNLRDLTISVANARLDEQSATLAVADAQKAMIAARQSGNVEDIQKANLAYQQSVEDLETAKNKTSDLAEENDKATKQGVQGSDAVVSARQSEADAVQAVADATRQLSEAQKNLNSGSGGGSSAASASAAAMAALSVNGRSLITTLKSISPAWSAVQRNMQNKMFAGVSGDVKSLSDKYLPVLNSRLGDMGSAFNAGIRSTMGLLGTKRAVGDVNTIMGNLAKGTRELGTAIAPVISGLLGLGAAGSSFLPMLFGWVHGLAVEFAAWVTAARKSGQLGAWLSTAETALHNLWIIGGNVAGIIGAIFSAGGAGAGGNLLGTIAKLTGNLRSFLTSTKGHAEIEKFMTGLRDVFADVAKVLPGVVSHLNPLKDGMSVFGTVVHFASQHTKLLASLLPVLAVGYGLSKVAQKAKIVADVIHIPVLLAGMGVTLASAIANKALATEMKLARVATEESTVAQDELNASMLLNPATLIVLAIIALIAIFVVLWIKCKWFRDFWKGLWHELQDAAGAVWGWIKEHWQLLLAILTGPIGLAVYFIKGHFHQILDFITGLPGKITRLASGMWDGIKNSFRSALNFVITKWNNLGFHLTIPKSVFGIPVPGGGSTIGLDTPNLPLLAHGAYIRHSAGGTPVIVGEGNEDEIVSPLSKVKSLVSGGGHASSVTLVIDSGGSEMDALILKIIRKAVRAQGGNGRALAIKTVG